MIRALLLLVLAGPPAVESPPLGPPVPAPARPVAPAPIKFSIFGPASVNEWKLVRLVALGVPEDATVEWEIAEGDEDALDFDSLTPNHLTLAGPPGTYTVKLRVLRLDGKRIVSRTLRHKFEIRPRPGTTPPVPVDPTKPTPPTPPIGGPVSLYFLVVRPDGPAAPAFTEAMGRPEWADLLAKGHKVKDKTLAEAAALGITLPSGSVLPCVVTLKATADGRRSEVARGPIPLPTSGPEITKLPEGVR